MAWDGKKWTPDRSWDEYPWWEKALTIAVILGCLSLGGYYVATHQSSGISCPSYVTQGSSSPAQDCYDYDHPDN